MCSICSTGYNLYRLPLNKLVVKGDGFAVGPNWLTSDQCMLKQVTNARPPYHLTFWGRLKHVIDYAGCLHVFVECNDRKVRTRSLLWMTEALGNDFKQEANGDLICRCYYRILLTRHCLSVTVSGFLDNVCP